MTSTRRLPMKRMATNPGRKTTSLPARESAGPAVTMGYLCSAGQLNREVVRERHFACMDAIFVTPRKLLSIFRKFVTLLTSEVTPRAVHNPAGKNHDRTMEIISD